MHRLRIYSGVVVLSLIGDRLIGGHFLYDLNP